MSGEPDRAAPPAAQGLPREADRGMAVKGGLPVAAMKKITDHEWQDLACMVLGVLILLSPWVVPNDDMGVMTVNTVVVGLAVLLVSELELAGHSPREEAANGERASCARQALGSQFLRSANGARADFRATCHSV